MTPLVTNLQPPTRLRALCFLLAAGLLTVGWWPLAPFPRNQVHWLKDRPGLGFAPPSVAFAPQPPPDSVTREANPPAADFTLELWLEAAREPHSAVTHILTIHQSRSPSPLVLCQWKDTLLLRQPAAGHPRGFRDVGVATLQAHQPRFVTVTSSATGTSFHVEGELVRHFPGFVLPPESLRGRLILGDAARGKHGWTGNLYGLAVLDRALSESEVATRHVFWSQGAVDSLAEEPGVLALYTFAEGSGSMVRDGSPHGHPLTLPSLYRVLQHTVLELPWGPDSAERLDVTDILLNLFGFVPFGFLVVQYLRWGRPETPGRNLLRAVLAGFALSLLIEIGQVWLPTRNSSALDLLCNTLGTLVGAGWAVWRCSFRRRLRPA